MAGDGNERDALANTLTLTYLEPSNVLIGAFAGRSIKRRAAL